MAITDNEYDQAKLAELLNRSTPCWVSDAQTVHPGNTFTATYVNEIGHTQVYQWLLLKVNA